MAFKQVKRRSSLFRPWASVASKIGKEAQDAQEDHLKKLKGFVREGITCSMSSTLTRFENSSEKHTVDVQDTKMLIPKGETYNKDNLDIPVTNSVKRETFREPGAESLLTTLDKIAEISSQKKENRFEIQDTVITEPSAFVRTVKNPKTVDNKDYLERTSPSDMVKEIKNSLVFNPSVISQPQLNYDPLRTFQMEGSHVLHDSAKHSFIPPSDIAHSPLLPMHSGDAMISNLAEFGPQLNFPATWDPLNTAALGTLSNSNQHPLLDAGIMSRWRTKKQRPKRFQCPHCQVSFSNNGQLKGHVRIHTGERPFACDHPGCGKTFTRNEELTRHKRIHTGVRPFPCPLCGKRFGRKDHLKKHVKTHQRAQVVQLPVSAFQGLPYFVGDCIPWF